MTLHHDPIDPATIRAERPLLTRWVVQDRLRHQDPDSIAIFSARHQAAVWLLRRRFKSTRLQDLTLWGQPWGDPPPAAVRIFSASPFDTMGTLTERYLQEQEEAGSVLIETETEFRARTLVLDRPL